MENKSKYWKFVIGFLIIMVLVGGGFFVWEKYLSPEAKSNRETQKNYEKYLDWQANYEKAMREDTYGGKTPQETLNMFIDALKKDDIELASKYFALNTNENSEYYLTRREWEEGLKKAEDERKLGEIINNVLNAKPDLKAAINSDYYVFTTRDKNGIVVVDIDLHFNKESGVWKITSL